MSYGKIRSNYLNDIFDPKLLNKRAEDIIKSAKKIPVAYDAFAFTGNSGSALAYILSRELGIPLLCVRKKSEKSHFVESGNGLVEGNINSRKYIFLDDCIDTGKTFDRVRATIKKEIPRAKCVGCMLYNQKASCLCTIWRTSEPSGHFPNYYF